MSTHGHPLRGPSRNNGQTGLRDPLTGFLLKTMVAGSLLLPTPLRRDPKGPHQDGGFSLKRALTLNIQSSSQNEVLGLRNPCSSRSFKLHKPCLGQWMPMGSRTLNSAPISSYRASETSQELPPSLFDPHPERRMFGGLCNESHIEDGHMICLGSIMFA